MKQSYPKIDEQAPPMPPLLQQLSQEHFLHPAIEISEEEYLRHLWEDMVKRTCKTKAQLKVASRNYNVWCRRQRIPNQLKIA